ncbi:MAG: FAD-dependent monooxygenase [Aestuariivirgaceae bacterium]|nr:FAD-dependent monooxygenase [Aestuariivirgaceae bacterium]
MTFLIAGGGIAGLSAGLALARAGRECALFEQALAFEETGAGLQLGPNGVKALRALGAWDAVEPFCFAPDSIHIRDGITGNTLSRVKLGAEFAKRFGAPYRVIHRADLLKALLAVAQNTHRISLHTARQVSGFSGASLQFADGSAEPFTALIGADGIRSTIRQSLLADGPPLFAGQVIYRALVPRTQITAVEPDVNLWLCPGGHVVHYPVSGGKAMNMVAAFDGGWAESWSEPGSREELMAAFPRAAIDLRYALGIPESWRKWAGAARKASPKWGAANVTLMGDAAHPMLPYLAQGAVMALEDAATLGACITRAPETAKALRQYEALRQPRTTRVAAASGGLARIYHANGLLKFARDAVLRATPSRFTLARMGQLYRWELPPH